MPVSPSHSLSDKTLYHAKHRAENPIKIIRLLTKSRVILSHADSRAARVSASNCSELGDKIPELCRPSAIFQFTRQNSRSAISSAKSQLRNSIAKTKFALAACLAVLLLVATANLSLASPRIRVAISPDNGRKDVLTPGWESWRIGKAKDATKTVGDVTFTLRRAGSAGTGLAGDWWKGGIDYRATLTSGGVFIEGGDHGGQLELVIHSLTPGKHTIVTYHNSLWAKPISPFDVYVNDEQKLKGVAPSTQVTARDDGATAYVEVDAKDGQDVVLRFVPIPPLPMGEGRGEGTAQPIDNIILNGFEIDRPDPHRQAIKPFPADADEHTAENPALKWQPAKSAIWQEVYFGTDAKRVAEATSKSPEFMGRQEAESFSLERQKLDDLATYYWRVDAVYPEGSPDGQPVHGELWSFRIRHLAFPSAEGYGRFAIGGRAGKVYTVTNLNDAGPGSLREAIEADEPRTIVFNVGGLISLKSKLVFHNPYLTVAGQTAPGKGICLRNYTFGGLGAQDTIIRYMRLRLGNLAGITMDGMGLAASDNCIIDHCSISWTIDEAFSSRAAKNITLQRCLISEALNVAGHQNYAPGTGHGYAASIGGDVGSFHHNLLADCAGRNWSMAGGLNQAGRHTGRLDLRNNVVYNWNHRTTDGGAKEVNFVGNYYKPGPSSKVFHVLMSERENVLSFGPQDYFAEGNVMPGHYDATQPLAGVIAKPASIPLSEFIKDKPLFESYVTTQSAEDAYRSVLADVGCNIPVLDDHDQRIIRETRDGTTTYKGSKTGLAGIPDSQEDVGGWEDYPEVHRPDGWDTDGDGIPDDWEKSHGLNPSDRTDGAKDSGDGYTNLEKYLNWLVEKGPNAVAPRAQ
jgi:hypothetical protein